MGVRLSGGVGPLRVSVSPGRASAGFFGLCVAAMVGMFQLMFWLLYAGYWVMRVVYWELPRAGWRWRKSRQERAAAGG